VSLLSVVLKSASVYSLRALSSGPFHCKPSVQRGQEDCERLQASHRVLTLRGRSRHSFPFRTISAFSAVSPPFESCEIDKQDQQQEHQQFHTSLPFRRASVIALLMPSALLVPLVRVYPPRLASTSAKQRIRVAHVGVLRVTGNHLTALTLPW